MPTGPAFSRPIRSFELDNENRGHSGLSSLEEGNNTRNSTFVDKYGDERLERTLKRVKDMRLPTARAASNEHKVAHVQEAFSRRNRQG